MNLLWLVGGSLLLLAIGALLGRYYSADSRVAARDARRGTSYARGLVEVLDGKADAAIAEISRVLSRDEQPVEAYFALGALFRQRGEYERAVRVHQTLLVRGDIDKAIRIRAHLQLALDFEAAGFKRRAVSALEWVIVQDRKHLAAHEELARLYEELELWQRAIAVHKRLAKLGGGAAQAMVAHLSAQLAQRAMTQGKLAEARKALRQALGAHPDSVHALYVLGELQRRDNNPRAAADAWERGLRCAPDLASVFCPRIEEALFTLDKLAELDRLLVELDEQHPRNIHLRLAAARLEAKRSDERAPEALIALVDDYPELLSARRELAKLVLRRGNGEAIRETLRDLLRALDSADRGFRCGGCGHGDEGLFWRCSSCGQWGTVRVAWGRRAGERSREARSS